MAPNVTKTTPVTGKSFRIEWDDVPMPCQRGIILGYFLYYQLTSLLEANDNQGIHFESANTTNNSIFIDDLALKSNFSVKLAAFTSKGVGVNSSIFYAMTGDFSTYFLSFTRISVGGGGQVGASPLLWADIHFIRGTFLKEQ